MKIKAFPKKKVKDKDFYRKSTESLIKRRKELIGKYTNKWYLANILVYPIICRKNKIINNKHCVFWDNLVLIKAKNHFFAYKKACRYGKKDEDKHIDRDGNLVEWKFAGVRDLVEILNPLDDEYELTYKQGFKKDFSSIKKMIPAKEELGLFQYEKYYKKHKKHSDDYMLKHRQRN